MRRPLLVLPLLALALLLSACSSADPGWTFAAPTVPPASTPAASGEATAGPAEPTPAGPTTVPDGGGDAVQISAVAVAFEQAEVTAPADKDFAIHFNNKDAGIQHNVEIKDAGGMTMFKGDLVTGVVETDYQVKALAAGLYKFVCTLHPNMVGVFKVGG